MKTKEFITRLFERFVRFETTTLASSVAFYAALSLAPLLILFVTISSKLSLSLQQALYIQVENAAGPTAARAVEVIIDNAKARPDLATLSGLAGVATLLFSASLIFGEMKFAFNKIFDCKPPSHADEKWTQAIWHFVRARFFQIGVALACLFLMASLLVSSVISTAVSFDQTLWRPFNLLLSFALYIGLFSIIFRTMPDVRIVWPDAIRGGTITALLFVIGKELIGFYLGHSAIGSLYGVAGSVILLLVWVYYSAIITFIGAHVSSLLSLAPDHRHSLTQEQGLPAR